MKSIVSRRERKPLQDAFVLGFLDMLPIHVPAAQQALEGYSEKYAKPRSVAGKFRKANPAVIVNHVMALRRGGQHRRLVETFLRDHLDRRHVQGEREAQRSRLQGLLLLASWGRTLRKNFDPAPEGAAADERMSPEKADILKKLGRFSAELVRIERLMTAVSDGNSGVTRPVRPAHMRAGTGGGRAKGIDATLKTALLRYVLAVPGAEDIEFGGEKIRLPPVDPPFTHDEAKALALALGHEDPESAVKDALRHKSHPLKKLDIDIALALATRRVLRRALCNFAECANEDPLTVASLEISALR